MSKEIEVTVRLGDKRLTIQGPEDFVRGEIDRFARTYAASVDAGNSVPPAESGVEPAAVMASLSERALVEEKRPRGHNEVVAVLAFALTRAGHAEFTPEDVKRAYIRARVRPPKVISQALRDAKNTADYLESGSARGTFKLSAHGERTVLFDLPRRGEKERA